MGDYKNIAPEPEVIEIGSEKVEITGLSISQTIQLSRFIAKKFFAVTKGISDSKLGTFTINDMLDVVLGNLNEEDLLSLLTIITSKDREWWKKNFKLSVALKVIRKVLEGEDIADVFTEGLQILKTLQRTVLNQMKEN